MPLSIAHRLSRSIGFRPLVNSYLREAQLHHRLHAVDDRSATIHAIWRSLQSEATELARTEHALAILVDKYVCAHAHFEDALTACIVGSLADPPLPPSFLSTAVARIVEDDDDIALAAALDLAAIVERDPAADGVLRPFLFYPGFRALQIYRAAHHLWARRKRDMALLFQSIASGDSRSIFIRQLR